MRTRQAVRRTETSNYGATHKWRILVITILTNIMVTAIPEMALSVLFKEISDELGLTIVQVGVVFGVSSLPFIIFSLVGGALADRIGPRRIMVVGTLIAGLFGVARGFAFNFLTLAVTVFLMRSVAPLVVMSGTKTIGQAFPSRQLGLANGLNSMGFALGFFVASMLSATVLSPLLGGWRGVLIAYGIAAAVMSLPWMFLIREPGGSAAATTGKTPASSVHTSPSAAVAPAPPAPALRDNIARISRLRNIWLLGFALFGFSGAVQGVLGYVPLYLRTVGWEPVFADGAVGSFHLISMAFVMPIALLSDRFRSRKPLIISLAVAATLGISLMSRVQGWGMWPAVLMTGFVRDAFMAILITMVIETPGVGPAFAATATGLVMTISNVGKVAAPPIGNSLAPLSHGAPFVFWAALMGFAVLCLSLYDRKRPTPWRGIS